MVKYETRIICSTNYSLFDLEKRKRV